MTEVPQTRILLVEDEPVISLEIKRRLQKNNFDVIGTASTGEMAIRKATELAPDIILMDIMLAGDMDGIQAAEVIINDSNIPIVYLTANADRKTIDRAKLTGPFGYLIKPFHEKELVTTLEMALYKHSLETKLRSEKMRAEEALAEVKLLQGLLPICSYCKNIRDDKNSWHKIEMYISEHSQAEFSHGICPTCYDKEILPQLERQRRS